MQNLSTSGYIDKSYHQKVEVEPTVVTKNHNNNRLDIREAIEGHTELAASIIVSLVKNNYQCLICIDNIRKKAAIWSCSHCYHMFHIGCLKKWKKSQPPGSWTCPYCRYEYVNTNPRVSCHCGKSRNAPKYSPFIVPHSCDEVCGKMREGTDCDHPCSMRCHPGSCPPCGSMKMKECFCKKTVYPIPCGSIDNGRTCGEPCQKLLNCGIHRCDNICHDGDCDNCTVENEEICFCGKETNLRTCGNAEAFYPAGDGTIRTYSCNSICQKPLDCGNHVCQSICHPDQCQPCEFSPTAITHCQCGQTNIKDLDVPRRESCLDPIPTCSKVCNKLLYCGKHYCDKICHEGNCSDLCTESVIVSCKCGGSSQTFECNEVFPDHFDEITDSISATCKRICRKLRSCGRHRCGNKCCPSRNDPTDAAGVHICQLRCGKMLNCKNHRCSQLCHKGHCSKCLEASFEDRVCSCGFTIWEAPIRCGETPPVCRQYCAKEYECGHNVIPHYCHWDGECPPCSTIVVRECYGKHRTIRVRCTSTERSCGETCGKPLSCGEHTCIMKCHDGECEPNVIDGEITSCGQKCNKLLSKCMHRCELPCHPGEECIEEECTRPIKVYCECRRISENIPCIGLADVPVLECDSICEKEKKNRRLAEAFGIFSTNSAPVYSDFLLSVARSCPYVVRNIEKTFLDFLHSGISVYRFIPSDNIQRKIAYELAKYYFFDTEKYHSRDVFAPFQLIRKRDSRIPNEMLSDIVMDDGNVNHTPTTIQIGSLNASVSTSSILECLLPDYQRMFTIHWIDDNSCLVVFNTEKSAIAACDQLGRTFKNVSFYNDTNLVPRTGTLVLGKEYLKSNRSYSVPSYNQEPEDETKPWETNAFEVLGDTEPTSDEEPWN
eukprot:TRINITY_DN11669_c0_g1_i1.p1 TRINITY_DN11669_c0_g1~~TRINITY_DN11669_c0_g1_i1.p1  ORF type:complete len:982 (+),score=162.28 TRINITY_DN11669_c0_g1_i1:289-2946(+)